MPFFARRASVFFRVFSGLIKNGFAYLKRLVENVRRYARGCNHMKNRFPAGFGREAVFENKYLIAQAKT